MYSVVVLMAMTGGADLPAFGRRGHGCCGCCGYQSCGCCGNQSCGCCGNQSCGCCGNNNCCPQSCGCCGNHGGHAADKGDKGDKGDEESSLRLQPARILVSTAGNAKVLVDDYPMKSTAKVNTYRTFAVDFIV
jgi:hypothetical protein